MSTTPFTLQVPDMHCDHCRHSIESALSPLGASVAFDMETRQVKLAGISPDVALAALAQIGYPASPTDS
ncbi:MAG: heavy-metal-associated domain-containing protein [Pararhodobacter sp.]|nr:heavy-metal-associated domain-containing protein [Pararhodobacter sp.]